MRIHCPARRPLNQHADVVCSRAQFNRAKGSREELPCGVKGQRALGSSINTRALYAVARNSIAKRESRGSKTLWQVQGRALPESRGRASGASFRKELL